MEPVVTLKRKGPSASGKSNEECVAAGVECSILFSRTPFTDSVKQLYKPVPPERQCEGKNRPSKKAKKPNDASLKKVFPFEKQKVDALCNTADLLITPHDGELNYVGHSLEILRECIADMPGLSDKSLWNTSSHTDAESLFDYLCGIFFDYLEDEIVCTVQLDDEIDHSDMSHTDRNIDVNMSDHRDIVRQLLRCIVLWLNWTLQLSSHAHNAFELARGSLGKDDMNLVLDTAIGIKESNRNMAFYSSVFQKLSELVKRKNIELDNKISDLLCKTEFIKNMIFGGSPEEATPWKKLSAQLSSISVDQNEIPYEESHNDYIANINKVRNEMRLRMDRKGYCDALSRECEIYNQELNGLNSRWQSVTSRFEQVVRQLNDLTAPMKAETLVEAFKVADAKRMHPLLQHFFVRLQIRMMHTPNREVHYKVVRERDYVLQVSLLAPRDMLLPSADVTVTCFPLHVVFYVGDGDTLYVREPTISTHSGSNFVHSVESSNTTPKSSGTPRSLPVSPDKNWGLEDFTMDSDDIPPPFFERLRFWYDMAYMNVWNCYTIDSYKRGKKDIVTLLPKSLQRKCASQYSFSDNRWTLSNSCASMKMKLELNESLEPQCRFYDFEQKGVLQQEPDKALVDTFFKDPNGIDKNNVEEVSIIYNIIHVV
ncbi:hypothetical protein BgAZ_201180 [Babesia gibsoni]|uniref:Uncharacterized protein n=1 Tax=Babesia gibsoni TaxID=33632 RepID=A0AAD8LKG7_BABGI|nr:hypothetical protein BgAZ_201180 [Babesia gibsoni]